MSFVMKHGEVMNRILQMTVTTFRGIRKCVSCPCGLPSLLSDGRRRLIIGLKFLGVGMNTHLCQAYTLKIRQIYLHNLGLRGTR